MSAGLERNYLKCRVIKIYSSTEINRVNYKFQNLQNVNYVQINLTVGCINFLLLCLQTNFSSM